MIRGLAAGAACVLVAAIDCAARAKTAPSSNDLPPRLPAATPTPALLEEGTALDSAVLVEASDERSGVDWENDWIWRHYGRFRKKQVHLLDAGDRKIDAIDVELADHTEKTLYFDITGFFGK